VYTIKKTTEAETQFEALPLVAKSRILAALQSLQNFPTVSNIVKLKGYASVYRKRVGDYRILFEVRNHEVIILVFKIGHRKDVYE